MDQLVSTFEWLAVGIPFRRQGLECLAAKIRSRGADYLLALKPNQKSLRK